MTHDHSGLRARAVEIANDVADRLGDPVRVAERAAAAADLVGPTFELPLAHGHAGISLLFAELARRDRKREVGAHAHLTACATQLHGRSSPIGLFDGLAGLAFASRISSNSCEDYGNIGKVVGSHARFVAIRTDNAWSDRFDSGTPAVRAIDYDLISGLTGLGVYLLADEPRDYVALEHIVHALTLLARTRVIEGHEVPAWWNDQTDIPDHRYGQLDFSLAHGISGPLAFLSAALIADVEFPGQRETIDYLATWLLRQRRVDGDDRPFWPRDLNFEQFTATSTAPPRRMLAWCWGNAGVAHSLRLAGRAMNHKEWVAEGVTTLLNAFDRIDETERIRDAGICHGWAGLLQIMLRAAADGPTDTRVDNLVHRLAERTLECYNADAPYLCAGAL
ncbi:lanthionine synthetase C family protein [Nocardia terpenica]|uniref:Lanthionine synthetase n=1 Tax=Nocardia terpenica TaxID=455432 RepID=A0A291RJH5_9NOCA|nr:lanthionine synthetase C family protein [Nocardia terpenica]ATL67743.1 hypothetical protein CRH09_17645 [Nocardia terpenica]